MRAHLPRIPHFPRPTPMAPRTAQRVVDAICSRIDAAGGWIRFARLHAAGAVRAGTGLLRRGRAQVRRRRRFRHRARDDAAVRRERWRCRCAAILAATRRARDRRARRRQRRARGGSAARRWRAAMRCRRATAILEVSPDLRERQRARIAQRAPDHAARVEWIERCPPRIDGAVAAERSARRGAAARRRAEGGRLASSAAWRGARGWCWTTGRWPIARCVASCGAALSGGGRLHERNQSSRRSADDHGHRRAHRAAVRCWSLDYGFPQARVLPSAAAVRGHADGRTTGIARLPTRWCGRGSPT